MIDHAPRTVKSFFLTNDVYIMQFSYSVTPLPEFLDPPLFTVGADGGRGGGGTGGIPGVAFLETPLHLHALTIGFMVL